jgi:acyl-CoA thioester hydrolase
MTEQLGRYPVVVEVPVAWGDMDAFGHVNNTVYLRWFESARIAYFMRIGLSDPKTSGGKGPILARTSCDYRLPLQFPDTIKVAGTVTKLGTTSFTMGYRVTSAAHKNAVAAEGEGIVVLIDYAKGGKIPLDDALKAKILEVEASA